MAIRVIVFVKKIYIYPRISKCSQIVHGIQSPKYHICVFAQAKSDQMTSSEIEGGLICERYMTLTEVVKVKCCTIHLNKRCPNIGFCRGSGQLDSGPNFIELLSTKICLAWHFFLDKNRITNQISICYTLLVTGIQLFFAYPGNHVKIWFEILFLSRQTFHAKQIFVLSSSMKLGPGRCYWHLAFCAAVCPFFQY